MPTHPTQTLQPNYCRLTGENSALYRLLQANRAGCCCIAPFKGAITGPFGVPIGGNQTLIASLRGAVIPDAVTLMLSGHIHSFEAINYAGKIPPQIVEGDSGDNLDLTPSGDLKGALFPGGSGVAVKDGISLPGFGFLLMVRSPSGWTLRPLSRRRPRKERECVFAKRAHRLLRAIII